MVSEISQTEKNKYCVYHLYTESKKIQQTSECNIKKKKKQTHRYREQTVVTRREVAKQRWGSRRYKLQGLFGR